MNRGFTLIEMIIYMALLGMLLAGAVLASYQLLTSQVSLDVKNTAGEEGGFVLRKLNWALSSVSSFTISGDLLHVGRYDSTTVDICLDSERIYIRENKTGGSCGDSSYSPITTSNVSVDSLAFMDIPADSGAPEGVTATLGLNGLTFTLTRYLRK